MESISEVRSSEGKGSSNYEFFEKFQIKPVGNGEIMLNKFHRDQMNGSLFKIGRTKFRGPVHRGDGGELFTFFKNSKKHL